MVWSVLLALAAALTFAAGSALQHRVAGDRAADQESRTGFAERLFRRPSWLVGLLLSAVAFALHAAALYQGELAVVQPIIVSGIVFAVIIRSALAHRRPPIATIVWLLLTWAGLALFLAVRPEASDRPADLGRALPTLIIAGVVAVGLALAARATDRDRRRGILLAAAAGSMFGLVAGDVKLIFVRLDGGVGELLTYWPTWVLPVAGLVAVVLNQRAYQSAKLSVTTPVLNIAEVLVAMIIGIVVLGESVESTGGQLVGQAVGFVLLLAGVINLARPDDTAAAPEVEASEPGRGSSAD